MQIHLKISKHLIQPLRLKLNKSNDSTHKKTPQLKMAQSLNP